jgi:predicted acylesterase/phospholipase RssA
LAISVTDLTRARSEAVTAGPLVEMILASGAFPGVFAARQVEDCWYWDGGLANPLPFDPWLDDPEIDTILLHVVANPQEIEVRSGAASQRMSHAVNLSHQIICDELLRLKTELARRAGKRLILLRTMAPRPRLWNPGKIGMSCIDIGNRTIEDHRATLEALSRELVS